MGILYREGVKRYQIGGKILTYKDNSDYFDDHARYSDSFDYDDQIRQRVYSGKWGYNPTTQTLHKLDANDQAVVPKQINKWATQTKTELKEEYKQQAKQQEARIKKSREGKVAHRVPTEEAWNPYGKENAGKTFWVTPKQAEQMRRDQAAHNMNAVRNHPLWLAPGMIFGSTVAPALGIMAELPQITKSTKNIVTGDASAMDYANVITMGLAAKTAPFKKVLNKADKLVPQVKKTYDKVATGNSILPYAWKVEKSAGADYAATHAKVKNKASLNADEADALATYMDNPGKLNPKQSDNLSKLTSSNKADLSKVDAPVTRVDGYYNSTTTLPSKRGESFSMDGDRSWSTGHSKQATEYARPDEVPEFRRTRLVIPSKYAKRLEFTKVPYDDVNLKRALVDQVEEGSTYNPNRFIGENELIGNVPGGYKVIGKSSEDGFNNLIIKPNFSKNKPQSKLIPKTSNPIGLRDIKPPSLNDNMLSRWMNTKFGKMFPREGELIPDTKLPELPKFDQHKFDDIMEAWRKKNAPNALEKEIEKEANNYYNKVTSMENKARAAAMDAEQGTQYVKAIEDLEKQGAYLNIGEKMSDRLNIRIKPNPNDGTGGYSSLNSEGRLKKYVGSERSHLSDREIVVYDDMPIDDVKRVVSHEGKHHYTLGRDGDFYSNSDFKGSLDSPAEISKTNPQFADDLLQPAFPSKDGNSKTMGEYLGSPEEIDAYVNTNFRDQLVDQGILKNHWDELDDTKIAQYLMGNPDKYSKKFLDMAGPDFVKNFNKGVYTFLPAAGLAGYGLTEKE